MKRDNPNIHHRRSIRLKGYDYSQPGLYFITICIKNRKCYFGKIVVGASLVDAQMILNDPGKMVKNEWLKLPQRFTNIKLHEYVIMPNHFHAILEIVVDPCGRPKWHGQFEKKRQPQGIAPTGIATTNKTIGEMIGAFESITTVEYIRGVKNDNWQPFDGKLWQRNYWEHIIRNENEYNRIAQYIIDNPIKWKNDKLNGGNGNIVMEQSAEYNSELWMV